MSVRSCVIFLGGLWFITMTAVGQGTAAVREGVPPAFVETIKVKPVVLDEEVYATGTLLSIPGAVIKAEIPGRITKVHFNSGSMVKEGEQLIEINPDVIKAQLAAAEAQFNLSRLNLSRAKTLYGSRDIAKSDFDQVQANYNADEARVKGLRSTLAQAIIVAPFAGRLGLSQISIGDYVNAGQNIVNLQTIDPLKVDFSISEVHQHRVAVGQHVVLKSDAYPANVFSGTVEAVESLINQNNRTLTIRASVPNPDGLLVPGGFVGVTLSLDPQSTIMVPQTAIVYALDGNYLFKMVSGKAEKTKVELGIKDRDSVEIKSGVSEGDVIVTTGQMKIAPNTKLIDVSDQYNEKTHD